MRNNDPDTLSIQFKITGRAVLVRNALIGAAVGAAAFTPTMANSTFALAIIIVLGSLGVGAMTAFSAMLGHKSAQSGRKSHQPLNRRAIWYTGLYGWWFGIVLISFVVMWWSTTLTTAFVFGLIAMVGGAAVTAGLTAIAGIIVRVLDGRSASQAQMLGEGGFDPLQHIESREHARR